MNPAYEIHVTYTINASATFHEEYLAEIAGMSVDELRERVEIDESAGRTLAQTIAELAPSLVDTTVQTPDLEEFGEPSLKQVLRSTYDPETRVEAPMFTALPQQL